MMAAYIYFARYLLVIADRNTTAALKGAEIRNQLRDVPSFLHGPDHMKKRNCLLEDLH